MTDERDNSVAGTAETMTVELMTADVRCKCGHLARGHYGAANNGICMAGKPNFCPCRLTEADVLSFALAERTAECSRLFEENQALGTENRMQQGELTALRAHINTALTVLKACDHDADDDELYRAWQENRYGGCGECVAAFVLRYSLDAARAHATPEGDNG